MRSLPRCKRLKPRKWLTNMSRRPRLALRREKLKISLLTKKKEENFTISRLNVSQLEQLANLRQKLRQQPNSSTLKVERRLRYLSSRLRPARF